jgi:hypothetical protein
MEGRRGKKCLRARGDRGERKGWKGEREKCLMARGDRGGRKGVTHFRNYQ